MRLRDWFKSKKAKAIAMLGCFAMLLGVGASVSVVSAVKENEVVETKAASSSAAIHGQLGSEGSWSDHNMTSLGGELYVLYNVAMKNGNEFGMKVNGNWWGQATYVDAPSGFGTSGSNMKYTGSSKSYDFIYVANEGGGASANRLLIVEASGSKTLTFNCSSFSNANYLHFWCTDHSDLGTVWPGKSVTLSSGSFSVTIPNCMNKCIVNYNGSTKTPNSALSTFTGDTATVSTSAVTWGTNGKTYILGSHNGWSIVGATSGASTGVTNVIKWASVSFSVGVEFKVVPCSNGVGTYYGDDYTSDSADGWGHFTAPHDGSDSNIVCKTAGTFDVFFNTSTHIIYLYMAGVPSANGFYMAGTGTFAGTNGNYTFAGTERMDSDPSGNNVAIKESASGLSVSNGSKLQFVQISDYKTIWYDIAKGGTWPKGWDVSSNQAEYTGSGGKFNFYVKTATGDISTGAHQGQGSATLYIVDVDAIDQYGFLYFATTASSGSVTLTSYENSTAVLSGVALSTITGWEESSAVNSFNGITGTVHLYKMPIYNLRGSDVGKLVNKVVFRVSGSNYTVTGLPTAAGATPHYYSSVGAGGTAAATTGMGAAAKAVFDLDEALAGGISICTLDDKWATLKSEIEAGRTGSSTLMDGAKITTYADKDKSSTTGVLVSDIYKEICKQLGVASGIAAWPLAAWVIPSAPKGNESPLTLTLWIVLGAGVLGLGAIGTAYFVSKKKKRPQA